VSATTPAEWASAGSLGVTAIALIGLALAFVDADPGYFDPRPLLGRAGDRLLVEAVRARATAEAAVRPSREACRDATALLILLTTSPKGALR